MLGPDFIKPDAPPVAERWSESVDSTIISEQGDVSNWWTIFNDPVLDKLVETAYQENLPLQIAGIRILEARAQLGIAVGGLYPQQQQATGNFIHSSEYWPKFTFDSFISYPTSAISFLTIF